MSQKPHSKLEKSALTLTRWIGSPQSILLHTLLFSAGIAILVSKVFPFDAVLLVLNTIVSLEAIYLALFIQLTVNTHSESLEEVEHDIDAIQEDVGEIQEDVDEIQKDVDELQEDVEEMSEEEKEDEARKVQQKTTLEQIHASLTKLMGDVEKLQKQP